MSPLTILRIEKLKTFGNVAGSDDHVLRNRETPNADPTRNNRRLIGGEDSRSLEEIVKEKISTLKHLPRKDAVLCTEMFLSASPEYFRPDNPSLSGQWSDERMQQWAIASRDWLAQNYGSKCVRAELHLDESTPHIHAYIVPLNDKTGRVSHDAMFGGRGGQGRIKLSKLQDSYAAALAPLGIERGVKGSKATHTKVKEYYQAVNSEPLTAVITNNQLAPTPFESASSYVARIQSDEHFQAINHQLADRKFLIERLERAEQRARDSEKERQQLEKRVQFLESQVEQLRDLPLDKVAWELGLSQERNSRWKGNGHIISIDGEKFYDFSPSGERGGGGSIDLTMHVNKCSFKEAVAWLNDRFGLDRAERAAAAHARKEARAIAIREPKPEPHIPVADESKWHSCRQYLTQTRGIPAQIVDSLHEAVRIYADSRGNTVFLMRDLEENPTGAYLRGEGDFKGYTKGTRRSEGHFYFGLGSGDKIQQAVLCKSPIDALSAAAWLGSKLKTVYIAVDSVSTLPKLKDFLADIPVLVAHDGDESGLELAAAIQKELPQAQAKTAPQDMDWNDLLLRHLEQDSLKREESKVQQQDLEL